MTVRRRASRSETPQRVRAMSSGSIIGDMGAANGGIRTADVVTETDCTIWRVSAAQPAALESADPPLALALQRALMLALAAKVTTVKRIAEWGHF